MRATLELMGLYGGERRAELDLAPKAAIDADAVERLVAARLDARRRKDFKESDRIRDELAAMGVSLKDGKNARTGELETTWELRR